MLGTVIGPGRRLNPYQSSQPGERIPMRLAPALVQRYPRRLPRRKCMTIAAGFVHRGGVLLCADTQHETATMKSHASKLHQVDYWDGHIAFAYAGNSAFALTTIEKCSKRIQSSHKGE